MTHPFDFQALVARATEDHPDAALLEAVQHYDDTYRAFREARRHNRSELHAAWQAAETALIPLQPQTAEGAAAKLRAAAGTMWQCPGFNLRLVAIKEAVLLLDPPKARRSRRAKGGAA